MGTFYPFVSKAMTGEGAPGPYAALLFFTIGVSVCAVPVNYLLMQTRPSKLKSWWHLPDGIRDGGSYDVGLRSDEIGHRSRTPDHSAHYAPEVPCAGRLPIAPHRGGFAAIEWKARWARIQCSSSSFKNQSEMDVYLLSVWLDGGRLCPDLFIATLHHRTGIAAFRPLRYRTFARRTSTAAPANRLSSASSSCLPTPANRR